jgi:hypothetical protein
VSAGQVVMHRVLQEKATYMADANFKNEMSKKPNLLIEQRRRWRGPS